MMRTGSRRLRAAIVASVMFATMLPAVPALAHGEPDQGTGQPGQACNASQYPGTKLVTLSESRQSFIPSRGGISSVDICVENLVGLVGTDFTLRVYEGGTAANPGPQIASVAHDTNGNILSSRWVHIDFPAEVPTTAGAPYVLGLDPALGLLSSVTIQWRATCNNGLLTSCEGVPDAYPDGSTNDLPGNADYAFRTNPLHPADLTATVVASNSQTCPGATVPAVGAITNESLTSVAPFDVEWFLSDDATLSADDISLGTDHIAGMQAGQTFPVAPPAALPDDKGPDALALGDYSLILEVDTENAVVESGEGNNLASTTLQVRECGQPNITGLSLGVVEDTVSAGLHQLQYTDLDWAGLAEGFWYSPEEAAASPGFSGNLYSGNLYSGNLYSGNLYSGNLYSGNLYSRNGFAADGFAGNMYSSHPFSGNLYSGNLYSGNLYSGNLYSGNLYSGNLYSGNLFSGNMFSDDGFEPGGFSDVNDCPTLAAIVDEMGIGAVSVANVPAVTGSWEVILDPLTKPVQNYTLAEAVAIAPTLTVCEVDLSNVVNATWLGYALSGSPLDDVDSPDPSGWCPFLLETGFDCQAKDFDPSTQSLLTAEAKGFLTHIATLNDEPLSSTEYGTATWRVKDMPLADFDVPVTRGGQLAANVALSNPSAVFDCASYSCALSMAALHEAGAVLDGATVGDWLNGLTSTGAAETLLGDLAMGMTSANQRNLARANWNLTDPTDMDAACMGGTYELTGTNTGTSTAVGLDADVTLAPGFVYRPMSASMTVNGGSAMAVGEPSSLTDDVGTRTYSFRLDGSVGIGSTFELTFEFCANEYLGHANVGSATVAWNGMEGPGSSSTASDDTAKVVERTPGEKSVTPVDCSSHLVIIDHVPGADLSDLFTCPVESEHAAYVASLWPPLGTDLDLIAYAPPTSSEAFNGNLYSGNLYSGNLYSGNGISGNLYSGNLYSGNLFSGNLFSGNGSSTTSAPDEVDDIPIEELAPADWNGLYALSANRDDQPEQLVIHSNFGDDGDITFAVTDYNGNYSTAPYVLTIQKVNQEFDLGECQPVPWDLTKPASTTGAEFLGSGDPLTVFVTNRQVTSSAYGDQAYAEARAAMDALAVRPEVNGIVLEVDADSATRAAYANWESNWCEPAAANGVADHVRSQINDLRATYPTIDTIVIAGGDELVPDFRLPDRSPAGNEFEYVEALQKVYGGNNPKVAAYAAGTLPTTDPYGNEHPLNQGALLAFPPSAGVSRMIEHPSGWVDQMELYVASDGNLDPGAAFISAYDQMVDGAQAAADALSGDPSDPDHVPTQLLTDETGPWDADDFRAGAFTADPDAAGWNAHTNHWSLLSDFGYAEGVRDVVTTEESLPLGGFVFSNGCHLGTTTPDILNVSPDSEQAKRLRDFPQALTEGDTTTSTTPGIAVANSGFGIFSKNTVGQGELLQTLFMEHLRTARNSSIALSQAKQDFYAITGVQDVYTYKTAHQLQMFGPGNFKLFGAEAASSSTQTQSTAQSPTQSASASTDIAFGPLDVVSNAPCTECFQLTDTAEGTKVRVHTDEADSTGTLQVQGMWAGPTLTFREPLAPGELNAGVWINDLTGVEVSDIDLEMTSVSPAATGSEPEPQRPGSFPAMPVLAVDVNGETVVTLNGGVATSTSMENGTVRGDVTLYTSADLTVRRRDADTTGCRPHIDRVRVAHNNDDTLALIDVRTDDSACGPNDRAAAIGTDEAGNILYEELTYDPVTQSWTGAMPIVGKLQRLLVQVANPVSVGYWINKVDEPRIESRIAQGVDLVYSGEQHSSGIWLGDVTATVVGTPGVTYTFHDGNTEIGSFETGQSFTISGDGVHDINGYGGTGAVFHDTVAIDGSAPTVTLENPTNGAQFPLDSVQVITYSSSDTGTGAECTAIVTDPDGNMIPVASGDALPTGLAGQYTVTVTCTDRVGNQSTPTSVTYTVVSPWSGLFGGPIVFDSPIKNPPQINKGISPSQTISAKFEVYLAGTDQLVSDTSIIVDQCPDGNASTFCAGFWQKCTTTNVASCGNPFATMGTTPTFSDGFHFNLAAPSTGGLYRLVVELIDGTLVTAFFEVGGSTGGGGGGGGGGPKGK